MTESNSYDSFGRPTNSSFSSRYQFTGREYDSFTGLQYSRARFYDPQIGRFISEDPIGFAGGDVNLYGYVWNNPLNYVDPFGLDVRAYYWRKRGKNGGGRLEIYDNDKPPIYSWKDSNSLDVRDPVGDYEWEYPGAVFDDDIFSGDGPCKNQPSCETTPSSGPIPSGNYSIGTMDGRGWFPLPRRQPDGVFQDFGPIGDGSGSRGQFRLHPGSLSLGCLTFGNYPAYKKVRDILNGLRELHHYIKIHPES